MPEPTTLPARKASGSVTRWDPLETFDAFQDEMDRFWRRPWAGLPMVFGRPTSQPTSSAPRLEAYEKNNVLIVKAEQVQANLQDGVLEIRIPKPAEVKPEAKKVTVS